MPASKSSGGVKSTRQNTTSTREAIRQRGPTRRQLSRHDREQRQRRRLLIGGAVLLGLIVAILAFGYWRENIARAQETVAVVYGERISADQLAQEVRPQLARLDRQIALFRANGMTQQATQMQFQRSGMPQTVLNDLIDDRIVRREAERRGIVVTSDEVDARIRQQVAQFNAANQPQPTPTASPVAPAEAPPTATPAGTPTPLPTATPVPTLTEDRFAPVRQEYLNQVGLTDEQLRRIFESSLYEEKLREAIGSEVPAVREQVHVRHIVLATEDAARAALEQLQGGADFAQVAQAQSTDSATKDKGGDLGWLPRQGQDAVFDSTAFALQPGQMSDVVQTDNGWEIIQVLERDPARPLEANQLQQLRSLQYSNWLSEAVGDPAIERNLSPEISDWVLQRAGGRRST